VYVCVCVGAGRDGVGRMVSTEDANASSNGFESFFAVAFLMVVVVFAICICCLVCSGFWAPILEGLLGLGRLSIGACCSCFPGRRQPRRRRQTAVSKSSTSVAKKEEEDEEKAAIVETQEAEEEEESEGEQQPEANQTTTRPTQQRRRARRRDSTWVYLATCGFCCGVFKPRARPRRVRLVRIQRPIPDDDTKEVKIAVSIGYTGTRMPLLAL